MRDPAVLRLSDWRRLASVVLAALLAAVLSNTLPGAEQASSAASEPAETTTYTIVLLHDASVRAELKIDSPQAAAVDALLAEVGYPLFLLRDAARGEREQALVSLQKVFRDKLVAILNLHQRERLSQLVFQARGSSAIVSPENVAALGLSKGQVMRVNKLLDETKKAVAQIDKLNAHRSDAERASLRNARYEQEHEKISGLLDDHQRSELQALIGKSFDLSHLRWITTVAPELKPLDTWLNSEPLELKQLRGKVVVLHFWAFGCSNCIHNLPHYRQWYETFPADKMTMIGLQTPETEVERSADNLRQKVEEFGIRYPVALDAAGDNWRAWANNLWPSVYLIDKQGNVRSWWYGELNWQGSRGEEIMRGRIEALIAEKG